MQPLTAAQLFTAWDQGTDQPPVQRALLLLAAACPGESVNDLACLSIGERDARLLTLREWTFGAELASVTDCPACREALEMSFRTGDIRAAPAQAGSSLSLTLDGYQVAYRLPNTLDLIAARQPGAQDGRQVLLERCLTQVVYQEQAVAAARLPAGVLDEVIAAMEAADPQADVSLKLVCPACQHTWQAQFDILAYFWSEIEAWAYRTVQEIHRLALAYGWSEAEILALSPRRRQLYLKMVV